LGYKLNQKQNYRNRKEKQNRKKRGERPPGPLTCLPAWPSFSRGPAQPIYLAARRLPLPVGRGEAWRAPESPDATSCFAALLATPRRRPTLPLAFPSSPWISLSPRARLSPSLSRTRALSPPPTNTTPAIASPSSPRAFHELRRAALALPAVTRDRRSPEVPPRRSSPPRTRRSLSPNSPPTGRPRAR